MGDDFDLGFCLAIVLFVGVRFPFGKVKDLAGFGEHDSRHSTSFLVLVFVAGLLLGGIVTGYITYRQITGLDSEIADLQSDVSRLYGNQTVYYSNNTILFNTTSLAKIYENVVNSVVSIKATGTQTVQGSGFVSKIGSGAVVVITNNHVVSGSRSVSVRFASGNGYAAIVNGTDPYADLAVLTVVGAPESELKPLEIVSSSTLEVGDPTLAIGAPYGLEGTMTTGVVSALGRTIREQEFTGGYAIANIIQTSTPINPGNSGGPLLNYDGKVIGITTAIVENSQGLGFAVPSNTILREAYGLAVYGRYTAHSYLGVQGDSNSDMDYDQAQSMGVNVTYGWRIAGVVNRGPAYNASILVSDIIIGMNGTTIRNGDEMSSYLEEHTTPEDIAVLKIARKNQTTNLTEILHISVKLGTRPAP